MDLNNSSNANEPWTSWTPDHTGIIFCSILLVWSLLGNVLVIAVVFCNQNLRTNMNYLIVNMAVSDLLVPLVGIPWMISEQFVRNMEWLVEGPLGEALCKLVPFLSNISPYVSSFNIVIIAFQRFVVVVYPTRIRIQTRKSRWFFILLPWIVAMTILSPTFFTNRLFITKARESHYTICKESWSPTFEFWPAQMIFISTIATVGFFIPLIAIITLYTIMHYKLRKSLNNVMELIQREMIRSRQKINRRLFNMSIAIILVFTICWCPLGVLQMLRAAERITRGNETYGKIYFAFGYLWYLQAAINPCIYFTFLKDFRQGLKRLCCRKSMNQQGYALCVCCVDTVTPGEDDQDPTCTPSQTRRTRKTAGVSNQGLTCTPLQSRKNTNSNCTRKPGGDSNQDLTCTLPHINTTSF